MNFRMAAAPTFPHIHISYIFLGPSVLSCIVQFDIGTEATLTEKRKQAIEGNGTAVANTYNRCEHCKSKLECRPRVDGCICDICDDKPKLYKDNKNHSYCASCPYFNH